MRLSEPVRFSIATRIPPSPTRPSSLDLQRGSPGPVHGCRSRVVFFLRVLLAVGMPPRLTGMNRGVGKGKCGRRCKDTISGLLTRT